MSDIVWPVQQCVGEEVNQTQVRHIPLLVRIISEPLARRLPSTRMKLVRLSLGKQWAGGQSSKLAHGLTASMLREVIVTVKAAKLSTTPKAEGERKNMFSLYMTPCTLSPSNPDVFPWFESNATSSVDTLCLCFTLCLCLACFLVLAVGTANLWHICFPYSTYSWQSLVQ